VAKPARTLNIRLPPVYRFLRYESVGVIRSIAAPSTVIEAVVSHYQLAGVQGTLVQPLDTSLPNILIVERASPGNLQFKHVLRASATTLKNQGDGIDLRNAEWIAHPKTCGSAARTLSADFETVLGSWTGAFSYVQEDLDKRVPGLRPPQLGAIHAIHAHWTTSTEPATVVMPTGTGKTETMIGLLVAVPCSRLLVIVPTDTLRQQATEKFLTLGILPSLTGVLSRQTDCPIVGTLLRRPTTYSQVDDFFGKCHVIVTTSHIAGQCGSDIQSRIALQCQFLFIDEAHHAEAPTWLAFRDHFKTRKIVQFTATPFREDGKPIDGRIIYKYSLRHAQAAGYFKTIKFDAVEEYDLELGDKAIAERAIHHLKTDSSGRHIVMARVSSVRRAEKIFELYRRHTEFHPIQLHSGIKKRAERDRLREMIRAGNSRVVVCVDMLGEGFDLPELKIAAFHDIRKSLAVTLQLAGRFIRSRSDLGDPVFIANVADVNVRDELRRLYERDPDWNLLLPEYSDDAIDRQVSLKDFADGFNKFPSDIPIQRIRPATSTVIYRTCCDEWRPDRYVHGLPGLSSCERVHADTSVERRTLVVVTARKAAVPWAQNDQVYDWVWELLILFWDKPNQLLFINSSTNDGIFRNLARAVAGNEVQLIGGNDVFRSFAGVSRLTLQNVGLTEQLGRLIRYTGRMGPDVGAGLSEVQKRNTQRTVLSGRGFETGRRTTVGASRKGRIWSMKRTNLPDFIEWCKNLGKKVTDDSIDPIEVLEGTLESIVVGALPDSPPVAIDWPEAMYSDWETSYAFTVDNSKTTPQWECELALGNKVSSDKSLVFLLRIEGDEIPVSLDLSVASGVNDYGFRICDNRALTVTARSAKVDAASFFYENPPTIWFANGACLEGNLYTPLKAAYSPFPRDLILDWNWEGIDLAVESQGLGKRPDSIQGRVILNLRDYGYDIVFDDDGPGESADVVAVRLETQGRSRALAVDFYHCKYSLGPPGGRIGDLYEVCGQAQKSIHWVSNDNKRTELFTHLLRREAKRQKLQRPSRIESGDLNTLRSMREMSRTVPVNLRIFIVQPGLSRSKERLKNWR
jgi:superfamily II DNA or RNA helicase